MQGTGIIGFFAIALSIGLAAAGPVDVEDSIDCAAAKNAFKVELEQLLESGAPILDETGAVVGIAKLTSPVYYEEHDGVPAKIQMVWKYCVPSSSLLALVAGSEDASE